MTDNTMFNFSKWQGLGNDFILVSINREGDMNLSPITERVCDRHFGIGADGLVPVRPRGGNEFDMRIFNADGSEAEMCGNVSRCVALYLRKHGFSDAPECVLHTRAGRIKVRVLDEETVRVDMGSPRLNRADIPMEGEPGEQAIDIQIGVSGRVFTGTAVSMGNPHFVVFADDLSQISLEESGYLLENAPVFPRRANIEFAQVLDRGAIRMRVWERGCGVTMACGTGACATAVAGVLSGRTDSSVRVILDGGELLIEYDRQANRLFMTGPAREVFTGTYLS